MDTQKLVIPNRILLGEVSSLLAEGKEVILMTKGNSMLPFIVGDRDSVRLKSMPEVNVGDVVLARIAEGHYVLHRIIKIDGQNVTLMGDGNIKGTEQCTLADICGTALAVIRPKGREYDPRSASSMRQARAWRRMLPFRRIILGIYRRTILKLI